MKETHSMSLNGISLDKYGELLANVIDKGNTIITTQFHWHPESTMKGGAVIIYQTEVNDPSTTGLEQLFGKQENEEDNIKQTTLTANSTYNDDEDLEKETKTYKKPSWMKSYDEPETTLKLEKVENCLVG